MPFALALLSSVLYGAADFMGGIASRRTSVFTATAASQLVGLALLLLAAFFVPGATREPDLLWGAAAGVSGGTGVLLLYRALAVGPVSTAAPLISMIALLVPVLAGIAGGERPGLRPTFGIVAGIVAVVLISGGHAGGPARARLRLPAGAVAAGVLIGAFLVCLARIGREASLWPLVLARGSGLAAIAACAAAARAFPPPSAPALEPRAALGPILGAGIADVTANLFYVSAAQRAPLSLVATIVSLAPATTVILAQTVLRERLGRRQGVGVVVALGALALLARLE